MTPAEARAVIAKVIPQFKISEIKSALEGVNKSEFPSNLFASRAAANGEKEEIRVDFPPPPHASQAILISRYINYPRDTGPLKTATVAALEQKYGAAGIERSLGGGQAIDLAWIDTPNGTRILDAKTPCSMSYWPTSSTSGNAFFAAKLPSPEGCGMTLAVHIAGGDPNKTHSKDLVAALWTTIIDYAQLRQMQDVTRQYIKTQAASQADQRGAPQL